MCAFDARTDNFILSYEGRSPAGLVLDLNPTACIYYGQQKPGVFCAHVGDTRLMQRRINCRAIAGLSCTKKERNAMRLLKSSLTYQVLEGFRRRALRGTELARETFGEGRMRLIQVPARDEDLRGSVSLAAASR